MSFIASSQGKYYEPGYFLANNEDCTRETRQILQTGATTADNGGKYVKAGTIYSETVDDTTDYIGIVYEDVDVTFGDMPGSVVTKGEVYSDRLPETLTSAIQTALEAKGFKFRTSPTVTRPDFD